MAPYHVPLPQGTDEQDGREHHVHQFVGYQDDAHHEDQESHRDEWCVDAEGALDLVAIHAQQQRDEYHAQQPGIVHQQVGGHDEEVLFRECQREA